jgi:hypothetical protein
MRPKRPLREKAQGEEGEEGPKALWDVYGSLSQNYRRDSIDSPFVEDEDSVTRSEIETFIDFNARRKSEALDLLEDGDGNDTTLSDAYIDVEHLDSRASAPDLAASACAPAVF